MNPVHRFIGPAEAPHASNFAAQRCATTSRAHGMPLPRRRDREIEGPICLYHQRRNFFEGRTLRNHAAQGGCAVQGYSRSSIRELYRSPEIEAIYRKWFESPVPPNHLNFNTPMSSVLRNALAHLSDSRNPASHACWRMFQMQHSANKVSAHAWRKLSACRTRSLRSRNIGPPLTP